MSSRIRLIVGCALGLGLMIVLIVRTPDAGGQSIGFRRVGGPFVVSGGALYWLDSSNVPQGWNLLPNDTFTLPPISPSVFDYYDGQRVITDTGEGWVKIAGVWTDVGPVPTTATVRTSWGQVKDRYRR